MMMPPMFSAAQDAEALAAMVSVVGAYTLDILQDSELRAQHKQQCAERLKMNDGAPYSDRAVLASLDWGVDALEEAITATNDETKIARLDHAEELLQDCALLDSRAVTAGVPNGHLSAWAHFNLAFVWKLRNDDRKAAEHMLEMFLVDPRHVRVDFAPALWEHLVLPHLSKFVNWYSKQRKSIMFSGTFRKLSEEQEMSIDVSRDFPSNFVNMMSLSAHQRTQLQALEKLYQDFLDENTKRYARYYKDCLSYETANKGMPLMPITELPVILMGEFSVPTDHVTSSTTMPLLEPVLLGQGTSWTTSSSRRFAARPRLEELGGFVYPEDFEMTEVPGAALDDDDPDSPHSNFRRPRSGFQVQPEQTTLPDRPKSVERTSTAGRGHRSTLSDPGFLKGAVMGVPEFGGSFSEASIRGEGAFRLVSRSGEGRSFLDFREMNAVVPNFGESLSVPNSGEMGSVSKSEGSGVKTLGSLLGMKAPPRRSVPRQPHAVHVRAADAPAERKHAELRDNSSSPTTSHDSRPARKTRTAPGLNNSLSSRSSRHSHSKDRKLDSRRVASERYDGIDLNLDGVYQKDRLAQNSNALPGVSAKESTTLRASADIPEPVNSRNEYSKRASRTMPEVADSGVEHPVRASTFIPEDSHFGNNFTDSEASGLTHIQEVSSESKDSESSSIRATGKASTTRTQILSQNGNFNSARLSPTLRRYENDDGVARSGPLAGERASDGYMDEDDENPEVAHHGPGWASERYHDDGLLRNGAEDSGLAENQGKSSTYRESGSLGATISSKISTPLTRPPKDFVCPITTQLFKDPVTLETGQTYERIAIQEWLDRGNSTCPITRQKLGQNHLPKTNYVLKRLVDAWKEQYPELAKEFGSSSLSSDAAAIVQPSSVSAEKSVPTSPYTSSPGSGTTSFRFSRRTDTTSDVDGMPSRPDSPVDVDRLIMDLKPAMSHLCTSENLAECERVMMEIARLILHARGDKRLVSILNSAGAIAGMMELLFSSQEAKVLSATLSLLSVAIDKDDTARQTVISADPEAGCLVGLLRKGLYSSVSVLFQLKLPNDHLAALDLLPLLVAVIKENEEKQGGDVRNEHHDIHSMILRPKCAAIMLLDQILTGEVPTAVSQNAQVLLVLQAVPALVSSLDQIRDIEVRTSLVSLLLCCIRSDGRSRNMIAKIINAATVVALLHSGNNRARTVAITFLHELIHLSRRELCTDFLTKLKAEGSISSMRVLLVYLQMAPLEQRPVAASLLLQLDLLEEPRKGSIYREEALDSLVEALKSTDWPCPAEAANTLLALGGRFSYAGKPMMKAWLLKIAGIDKYFLSMRKSQQDSNDNDSKLGQEEEERAAKAWERKVAGALVGHDLGTLIEALGQGIQSKNAEVSKPCMTVATWLTHMLPKLPDTGVRQTARTCLLDHFVGVLQTSKDLQQRVLAALAVHSFISDPEGVQELMSYVKDVRGPLWHLKKATWTAKEILRALNTGGDATTPDLWVHAEQGQLDVTANGEVRCLVKEKSRMFSGHTNGIIKVWEIKKRFPVLVQELKEHSKSVMAMVVSRSSNQLYSGSLDKSIRVWALGAVEISCVQVFDLKDAVVGLLVDGPLTCIIPQGAGLKVQFEETVTKTLIPNKHVHSVASFDGKIFCGCADNSLQELDPLSESVDVIQHGVRTLLGKKPIFSTQVYQDHLYVAGASVDGVAGKIWKLSDSSLVGTICTTSDVRSMALSEDFIYLGSSSGVIEVWLRERLLRVSTMNAGSKVICLILEDDTLYSGHGDGKIRIWTMI